MSKNETGGWTDDRIKGSYDDIPETLEITRENCRNWIPYWLRLQKSGTGADKGRGIHIPMLSTDSDDEQPLCCSRCDGSGKWERKDLAIFPPPWDQDKLCDKCLTIINGNDYMSNRG